MPGENHTQRLHDAARLAAGVHQVLLNEIRKLRDDNAALDIALRLSISALLAAHDLFGHGHADGDVDCRLCQRQRNLRYHHESLLVSATFQGRRREKEEYP